MSIDVTTLANGMRVATDRIEGAETATLGIWVDVGARNEPEELHGVSHLLEHMAFKGTKRRNARMIAQEIEDVGGQINAYTSKEHTAYHARVLKDDVPLAIDVLADILQNSTFDADELEKERSVVVQEIAQVQDTPDDIIFDIFQERAFPDQPIGRSILGTCEGVSTLPREAVKDYMERRYKADKMILAAAGAVEHDKVVSLAEELFSLPRSADNFPSEPARYAGGSDERQDDIEQFHLVLGCDGFGFREDNFYAVQILTGALGGGMSSRLFQEIREEHGLAYSVYAFHWSFIDGGLFGVYAGCAQEHAGDVADMIVDNLLRVSEDLESQEIDRARAQITAGLLMARESTSARCETLARQLLIHGRPISRKEILDRIGSLELQDIRDCAGRIVSNAAPTVATLGPVSTDNLYDRVASRIC